MTPGELLAAAQDQGAVAASVGWVDGVLTIMLTAPADVAPAVVGVLDLQASGGGVDWQTPDPGPFYFGLNEQP